MKSSRIPGFYKLSVDERLEKVKEFAGLTDEEVKHLRSGGLDLDKADHMIENVIGMISLPLGIATNFLINDREYLIPLAVEEPSVVAAASNAAKIAREGGGFKTSSTDPIMISQVQLVVDDPVKASKQILDKKKDIMKLADEQDKILLKHGGGCRDLKVRIFETESDTIVVVHLHVDVRDAMGANVVNTMAEAVAPYIEKLTGGRVYLRILSNYAVERIARAGAVFPREALGGDEVVDGIVKAYEFAAADVYRAVTHNKGVMNGITSVVFATGNDTRAIEAGAHAYAARDGVYTSLTKWWKDQAGDLVGSIKVPLAFGLIGGATKVHPVAKTAVKILGVKTAQELAEVAASVGLAQNLAALRALATDGIQKGHMSLHARNIAVMAGAKSEEVEEVAKKMAKEGKVKVEHAEKLLKELRRKKKK